MLRSSFRCIASCKDKSSCCSHKLVCKLHCSDMVLSCKETKGEESVSIQFYEAM